MSCLINELHIGDVYVSASPERLFMYIRGFNTIPFPFEKILKKKKKVDENNT